MTDERAPEIADPIEAAVDRTREAQERLRDVPVDPPPEPPRLTRAADRVVHRADDLLELASDEPEPEAPEQSGR